MKDQTEESTFVFSVVICTHNRVKYLRDAIQSVCDQEFASQDFEILVVDNASTDDTQRVILTFCESYPFVRYLAEPKVGLSHARNRGWQEAKGEYIAYLDDDAKASSHWLSAAHQVIREHSPEALGGPHRAFFDQPKPAWFKESYGSRFPAEKPGPLERGFLIGNNFFVRRDVFTQVGGFDPRFGMTGNTIAYAEEVHLQHRIRDHIPGAVIYYDPEILIYHLVRLEKHTLWWRLSSSFASSRDYYRSHAGEDAHLSTILGNTVKLFSEFLALGFKFIFRDRRQFPFWQNFIYEQVRLTVGKAGKVFASWLCFFSVPADREKNEHAPLS